MNQVLINNYNPINNPLSSNYNSIVDPMKSCQLNYFPTPITPSDYPAQYENQCQPDLEANSEPGDSSKWAQVTESNERGYRNSSCTLPSGAVTLRCGLREKPSQICDSENSPLVFGKSTPVFPDSGSYSDSTARDYEDSSEVFDDTKYTELRSEPDYDESSDTYEPGKYNSSDYYPQNYSSSYSNYSPSPHSSGLLTTGGHNPAKVEIYDMDHELDHFNDRHVLSCHQIYNSCLVVPNGEYDSPRPGGEFPVVKVGKRRNTANKKERKRTLTLNKAFSLLRACIPNVPMDTKLSKIKTLILAKEYMLFLMEILNSTDPRTWEKGFKADKALYSPRKTPSQGFKQGPLKASNQNTDSNSAIDARKTKGRTGWPQDVWAFELKPQQYSPSQSGRV